MYFKHFLFICFSILIAACGLSEDEVAIEKCIQNEIMMKYTVRAGLKHTFDAPLPKRNRSLTHILGDTIKIEGHCKPLTLYIVSSRKSNMIINLTYGDTIFNGTVCKYRDLYYLNEKINDTTYRIFALKITDSLIYGLQNYFQYADIDSTIEHGDYTKLVKYKNKNTIRLHPNKRELRKLYSSIIDKYPPFVIIKTNAAVTTNETEEAIQPIEADDYELIANVYPNPASDILNIDLQKEQKPVSYYVSDLHGKIVQEGKLQNVKNKLNIDQIAAGIYVLTIGERDQQMESVKIVKVK